MSASGSSGAERRRASGRLTDAEVAAFDRDGWLRVDDVLGAEDLAPVEAEIAAEIDRRADERLADGRLADGHGDAPFTQRLTRLCEQDPGLVWEINRGQLNGPGMFALLTNPRILDLVESLVGPEIVASAGFRLRPKMPGFWHCELPWHQDSAVFEPGCDAHRIVTVWVPLVDATAERGCLRILPGSHRSGLLPHHHRRYAPNVEIRPDALPSVAPVTVPAPRGSVVVFTNLTAHSSLPNTSDVIRWSVDIRFQSARDVPTNARDRGGAPLRPVGAGEPVACFPPEGDVLVRSRSRPEEVVRDRREFADIRAGHAPIAPTDRWGLGRQLAPFHYEGSTD